MKFDTAAATKIVAQPLPFDGVAVPKPAFEMQQQQQRVNPALEASRRQQAQLQALQQ